MTNKEVEMYVKKKLRLENGITYSESVMDDVENYVSEGLEKFILDNLEITEFDKKYGKNINLLNLNNKYIIYAIIDSKENMYICITDEDGNAIEEHFYYGNK